MAHRRGAAVGVVEALRLPRARCPQGGGERCAARAAAGGDRRRLGCDIGSVRGIVVRHAAHGTRRATDLTRRFRPTPAAPPAHPLPRPPARPITGLRQTLRPPHSKMAAADSRPDSVAVETAVIGMVSAANFERARAAEWLAGSGCSAAMTTGWRSPFELIAESCSWVATPWRSVNVPPAASTIGCDRGQVVGGDADGVDGDVDGTFGDEHVLPEVAEAARAAGPSAAGRRAHRSGRARPSRELCVMLTCASARSTTFDTCIVAVDAVDATRAPRDRRRPTSDGGGPAPTPRRARRRGRRG